MERDFLSDPLHPSDMLRLEVVAIRAKLRTARQDLARKKRAVVHQIVLTGRTAKEREAELDRAIHEHLGVMSLEDLVSELHADEEKTVAYLENSLRPQVEFQWYVREALADAQNAMAASLAALPQCATCHMAHTVATATGDKGGFVGESDYIKERSIS